MPAESVPKILFLCVGNSCRSQMAEAWTRRLHAGRYEVFSAGSDPKPRLDPRAEAVMREAGLETAGLSPKTIASLGGVVFDYVITLCGEEAEVCPRFPGRSTILHRGFDDPPAAALGAATEEAALLPYRRVQDEIRRFIQDLPVWLEEQRQDPFAPKLIL